MAMIMIIGLLVLIVAAVVAVAGVATNLGSAHPLGHNFAIFGHQLSGLSTGQLLLCGIVVGVVGTLGLSMLLGGFSRRMASRGSRRELKGSQRETAAARSDRDRLAQQLDDEHTEQLRADPSPTPDTPGAVETQPRHRAEQSTPPDQSEAPKPGNAERSTSR